MWPALLYLNSAELKSNRRQFFENVYICQDKPTRLIRRSNNVAIWRNPTFLIRLFLKSKNQFNYEGHHNEVSWHNTSHRGIVLGEIL